MILRTLLAATLFVFAVSPALCRDAPRLVLATYAYPKYDRAAALRPLAAHLSSRLSMPVDVVVHASPRELVDAIRDGRVDVAVTNTAAFLETRADPAVRASAVFDVPHSASAGYRGVLVTRRDRIPDAAALARDAALLRYAQVLPGSTSGGLVQDLHLAMLGIKPSAFAERRDAGTHEAALRTLVDGTADVAALAEEPWRALQTRSPEVAAGLVQLWRSPPIPPGPIVCRASARVACGDVERVLLALDRDAPAALASLAAAWSEAAGTRRLVPVAAAAYDALGGAPAAERGAYRNAPKRAPTRRLLSQSMRTLNT